MPFREVVALARYYLTLLAGDGIHDPQTRSARAIGDESDPLAVPRPARIHVVELSVRERQRVAAGQRQQPELVPLAAEVRAIDEPRSVRRHVRARLPVRLLAADQLRRPAAVRGDPHDV